MSVRLGDLGDLFGAREDVISVVRNIPGIGSQADRFVSNLETVVSEAASSAATKVVVGGIAVSMVGTAVIAAIAVKRSR